MEDALPLEADGLRSLGAAMARLDAALAGLRHPAESHPLPWDLQHTAELEAHASEIPAGALREAAARGRARFVERVAPRLGGLRAQLIHNDWNLHNVRMAEGRFCGLLDFGDLVRGPLIQELAVAASYHCRRSADPCREGAKSSGLMSTRGRMSTIRRPSERRAALMRTPTASGHARRPAPVAKGARGPCSGWI